MSFLRIIGLAVFTTICFTFPIWSEETKIKRSDLPEAVEKTVTAEGQGATIRGFSKEREHGQTFYEAELIVNGRSKDILIDANGAIVEVEEQVAMDSLSPAVRDGLQAKAGNGAGQG